MNTKNRLLLLLPIASTLVMPVFANPIRPEVGVSVGGQTQTNPTGVELNTLFAFRFALPTGGNHCPINDAICTANLHAPLVWARIRTSAAINFEGGDVETILRNASIEFIPLDIALLRDRAPRTAPGFGQFGQSLRVGLEILPIDADRMSSLGLLADARFRAIGTSIRFQSFPHEYVGVMFDAFVRAIGYRLQQTENRSADGERVQPIHSFELADTSLRAGVVLLPNSHFAVRLGGTLRGDLDLRIQPRTTELRGLLWGGAFFEVHYGQLLRLSGEYRAMSLNLGQNSVEPVRSAQEGWLRFSVDFQ